MIIHKPLIRDEDLLRAYARYSSNAAIFTSNPLVQKNLNLPGQAGPNSFTPIPVSQIDSGGIIRGEGFQIDPTTKFFIATRDMFAAEVQLYSSVVWPSNDNICLGICIGNTSTIPAYPGIDQVGQSYISRFFDNSQGGNPRIVTLKVSQSPIGRNTTQSIGIKQGELIFPVMWTQETDAASVQIYDIIFNIVEIPYVE